MSTRVTLQLEMDSFWVPSVLALYSAVIWNEREHGDMGDEGEAGIILQYLPDALRVVRDNIDGEIIDKLLDNQDGEFMRAFLKLRG